MATLKELPSDSYTQAGEMIKAEQNGFARFIEENSEALDGHAFLTYELRDEEAGWKNSPTLDSIVENGVNLNLLLQPQLNRATSKQMRRVTTQVRTNIANFVFGITDEKTVIDKSLPVFLSKMPHNTPKSRALIEALGESLVDFRTSYNEAISPLVSGIRESKSVLAGVFEEFLLSNPKNMFEFADFLSDKKNNGAKIEAIRPFLASLADSEQSLAREKKEGTLRRAARKWSDELKEKTNPAAIDEFVPSIKSLDTLEWLKFAAQGETITSYLRSRPDVSTWPTPLREALYAFVSSRYFTACSSIERELGEFRRPSISKPTLPSVDLALESMKRLPGKVPANNEQDDEDEAPEDVEKAKYPIGILAKEIGPSFEVRILKEDEWTRRLQKEADSLAPADRRMKADLERIILSLREDPYGLGTKKLIGMSIGVKKRSHPIRSMNPARRTGFGFEHPESHSIRITYVIYRGGEVPVIGIEGIYNHEDYMKKFT